jgi:hypothetical protein
MGCGESQGLELIVNNCLLNSENDIPNQPHTETQTETKVDNNEQNDDLIYVVQWQRRKHAIVFYFSNHSFQVCLFDVPLTHTFSHNNTTVKFQIIGFWLPPFESSFLNIDNSICYENSQNDYTQLIVLFEMFLISIKRWCVIHNIIEKKGAKDQLFETLQ